MRHLMQFTFLAVCLCLMGCTGDPVPTKKNMGVGGSQPTSNTQAIVSSPAPK